ncbi:MAG: YcgN family cysteine cluster protein [Anaerolineaceae bacterium]|nr:YcgN family cysteine cluster protein [Anaerolineaceae bacterium]
MPENNFWKKKTLHEMNKEEWEALCDGCGKCCLFKLEDIDTAELIYTTVACRLLEPSTCACKDYANRFEKVETCVDLTAENTKTFNWLPRTCAYRRLAEGKFLQWWHPLISGSPETVHKAGVSVRGKIITEDEADMDNLEDYYAHWVF